MAEPQKLDEKKILDDRAEIIERNKAEQDKVSIAYRELSESIYKVEKFFWDNRDKFDESSIVEFYSLKDNALKQSMTILKNIDRLVSGINFSNFKQKLFGKNLARMNSDNNQFKTQIANGLDTLNLLKTQFDELYTVIQLPSPSSSPAQSPRSGPTQSPSSSLTSSPSSTPRFQTSSSDDPAYTSGGKKSRSRRFKQTKLRQRKIRKKYKHKYTKRRH